MSEIAEKLNVSCLEMLQVIAYKSQPIIVGYNYFVKVCLVYSFFSLI